jgi:hypothetical protein
MYSFYNLEDEYPGRLALIEDTFIDLNPGIARVGHAIEKYPLFSIVS